MNLAVICELNPFHNGHKAIFQKARELAGEDAFVFAVMSGNFVERGEPAIINKWSRAEIAVKCGADAVLEIPCVYSSQSAQFFAEAAVDIIVKTGVIDGIVFGSETSDLELLENAAKSIDENDNVIKKALEEGLSYPKALERAQNFRFDSNDLLAIEYIRAIEKRKINIKVFPVKRLGNVSHIENTIAEEGEFTSARAIREAIKAISKKQKAKSEEEEAQSKKRCEQSSLTLCTEGAGVFASKTLVLCSEAANYVQSTEYYNLANFMPGVAFEELNKQIEAGKFVVGIEAFEQMIISKVREMDLPGMQELSFVDGGLAEKLLKECRSSGDILKIIENSTSRYYTRGRIRRSLLSVVTGSRKTMFSSNISVPYIRVLSVNSDKKTEVLRSLSKSATSVICGNIPKNYEEIFSPYAIELLSCEIKADDIYTLGYMNKSEMKCGLDLSNPLVKSKK